MHIVTGDTQVVDRGKADGVFINTAGVGVVSKDQAIRYALSGPMIRGSGIPLDLRKDTTPRTTAGEWLATASESEIREVIRN